MQTCVLAPVQADGLGLGLYQGAVVAIDVLVELDDDVLVIGSGTVVGDRDIQAELVAGDDPVGRIGDIQRVGSATQRGGRHLVERDVL